MISSPGHYLYVSPGREDVCGIFIIGSVNQIVALEFTGFDIDCDREGLLVVGICWLVAVGFYSMCLYLRLLISISSFTCILSMLPVAVVTFPITIMIITRAPFFSPAHFAICDISRNSLLSPNIRR